MVFQERFEGLYTSWYTTWCLRKCESNVNFTYRFQLPLVLYFPSMSDLVGTGQRLTTYLDISPIWLPSRQYGTTLHMVLANGVQDGEVGRFISPDTRRLCRLRKWCRILCQTRQATFSDGFSKSCHWSYMRYILLPPTVLQLGVHCSGAPTHWHIGT